MEQKKTFIKRKVSILMASFPYRKKWMLQCIERLMPQCDNFYLWLNEYKEMPEELKKFDQNKLHVTLGDVNLKECGRYTFLWKPELQDDYCFICDDDINWPKDYVKNTLDCFKRHGDGIVAAYYVCDGTPDFVAEHRQDDVKCISMKWVVPHQRIGAGTMAFVPGLIRFQFTKDELLANYDIEMFMGKQCLDRGIKVYSPKRCRNWLTFMSDRNQTIDKYALHLSGNENRIKYTHDYLQNKRGKTKAAIGVDVLLKHSYVISIDDTRLQRLNKVFRAVNLSLPNKFSGVKTATNTPQVNCFLSHKNAILKAKEQDWPYVCIFEDDAYPMVEVRKKLQKYLSCIPKDCAVLLLGVSRVLKKTSQDEMFNKGVSCYGAHAYVVFKEYYDKVLQHLEDKQLADWFQTNEDGFIKKSQVFMPKENLFIQYCDKVSMNKHSGYILRDENGKNYTNQQIFNMGFCPIERLLNKTVGPVGRQPTPSSRGKAPPRRRYWFG